MNNQKIKMSSNINNMSSLQTLKTNFKNGIEGKQRRLKVNELNRLAKLLKIPNIQKLKKNDKEQIIKTALSTKISTLRQQAKKLNISIKKGQKIRSLIVPILSEKKKIQILLDNTNTIHEQRFTAQEVINNFHESGGVVISLPPPQIEVLPIGQRPTYKYDPHYIRRLILEKEIYGRTRIIYYIDGKVEKDIIYNIPVGPLNVNRWWKKGGVWGYWAIDSDQSIFEFESIDALENGRPGKQTILFLEPSILSAKRLAQKFADGVNHCLLYPMVKFVEKKLIDSKNNSTLKQYKSLIKKLNNYTILYKNGIPEKDLQEISNDLKFNIEIKDPLRNTFLNIKCIGKRLTNFKYINTKENHVEIDELTLNSTKDNTVYKTQDEMNIIKNDLETKKIFHTYNRVKSNITCMKTIDTIYNLKSDYRTFCQAFEEHHELTQFKMDYIKNKDISDFIRCGVMVSSCVDYDYINKEDKPENLNHIDQIKNYTQYKTCKYYKGFPTLFTDYRKAPTLKTVEDQKKFLDDHLGYFYINNIDLSKCEKNILDHLKKLNIYNYYNPIGCDTINKIILPSVECKFLLDLGITFNIDSGAWGVSSIDFDMKDFNLTLNDGKVLNMVTSRDVDNIPYYCKWSGKLHSLHTEDSFYINCTKSEAEHLKSIYENVSFYEYNKKTECKISFKKDYITHMSPIFGFITSYARMGCLEQLFKIPCEKVVRVNMDGIFYEKSEFEKYYIRQVKQHMKTKVDVIHFSETTTNGIKKISAFIKYHQKKKPGNKDFIKPFDKVIQCRVNKKDFKKYEFEINKTFRRKPANIPNNDASDSFIHAHIDCDNFPTAEYLKNCRLTMNIGCGGSGKTHANCTDDGFINPFFTTISWKLTTNKTTEYNIKGSVIHRLLGINCENKYLKTPPPLIVLDETTQYTNELKNLIISTYPHSKLNFCGDFGRDGTAYQLPPHKGVVMTFDEMNIRKFKKNWRTNDKDLLKILKLLRNAIELKFTKKDMNRLMNIIIRDYKLDHKEVDETYNIDDLILVSRRSCSECKKHHCEHLNTQNYTQDWTTKFKGKFKDKEKYLINKCTKTGLNGEIKISNVQPPNSEVRHAFTVHAIQGETCPIGTTLYIDPRNFFDPRMCYTAFSRARTLGQIKIIKYVKGKEEKKVEKEKNKDAKNWLEKYENVINKLNKETNFKKIDIEGSYINKKEILIITSWPNGNTYNWWNETMNDYKIKLKNK